MTLSIVFIAETRSNFISTLQKNYTTQVVRSGKRCIDILQQQKVDVIVLDAISLRTNGERICRQLRDSFPKQLIIHLHPSKRIDAQSVADTVLSHPVLVRSLLNAIETLTSSQQMPQLTCGNFTLDLERRILFAQGNEIPLTPKQSALVEAFLRHPNETLERKWLMQHVWDTDYTGDTRTLNVHIRFVREAMEVDASKPQFIKTVRGVGYRFDSPLNKKADL